MLFKNNNIILVPQHSNRNSLCNEAKRLKSLKLISTDLNQNDIHVIADDFHDDIGHNQGFQMLKGKKTIFIDEIYQVSQDDIFKIYLLKIIYGVNVIGASDIDQIPPQKCYYNEKTIFFCT